MSLALPTATERRELFLEAAARRGLSPVVVEKDYWVCLALTALFNEPQPVDLIFKGGTSLSKCYGLIERFSEDVDLAFDRAGLGFTGDQDPEADGLRSNQRKRLIQKLSDTTVGYVGGAFRDATIERLGRLLPNETWSLEVDDDDKQTLLFAYPISLDRSVYSAADYVRPAVRLELGARSDQTPCEFRSVSAITTEEFGADLSGLPSVDVPTLSAERTFWEKASLLHAENYREHPFKPARARSRHLYDLVQLARAPEGQRAISDVGLRDRVVAHKSLFFASASARYDLFQPPTIRLLPEDAEALVRLKSDHNDMRDMFFGEQPDFDELVQELASLEQQLNDA